MFQPESEGRARARSLISRTGYPAGGHFKKGGGIRSDQAEDRLDITKAVHEHEGNMHPGMKKTALKLADGGVAAGGAPGARGDRPSRGKKGGAGKTHVNILIAPQGDKAGSEGPPPGLAGLPPGGPPMGGPPPMPIPRPPPPPMAPPTGAPPLGVGAPMGGAPPLRPMPPGPPPPMMRKSGGAVRSKLQMGGLPDVQPPAMPGLVGAPPTQPPYNGGVALKSGGRSYSPPKMTAGAGSGEGRLEKIKD